MTQKTAVEFLLKQYIKNKGKITSSDVAKAKEMEKEQIQDAWDVGKDSFSSMSAEQYYNETFKK